MRKSLKFLSFICLLLSLTIVFNNLDYVKAESDVVFLGGMPAGFSIETKGAHIVGVCDVITLEGIKTPSKSADLRNGDVIIKINGQSVNSALDVSNYVKSTDTHLIEIKRQNETLIKNVIPAKDLNGEFRLGVFIRDDICGIGTITFINSNRIASLGHPVIGDNGELVEIIGGDIYSCSISGCVKGEKGKAGELRGVLIKDDLIAKIDKNLECGVYGEIIDGYNIEKLQTIEVGQAKIGNANVVTTINGSTAKSYNISIIKIDNISSNKNFVIRVDDENLLTETGGIVQGMSGSPIVQDGKLVGAVTHVFINDPTRGFGISIQNMLNN